MLDICSVVWCDHCQNLELLNSLPILFPRQKLEIFEFALSISQKNYWLTCRKLVSLTTRNDPPSGLIYPADGKKKRGWWKKKEDLRKVGTLSLRTQTYFRLSHLCTENEGGFFCGAEKIIKKACAFIGWGTLDTESKRSSDVTVSPDCCRQAATESFAREVLSILSRFYW